MLLRGEDEYIFHQAGAFPTEAEAQKVLDMWRAEGQRLPVTVRATPSPGLEPKTVVTTHRMFHRA